MTVMADETARILAEHGDPVKIAEYAVMCAQGAKRRAREGMARQAVREGRPTDEGDVAAVLAVMRDYHDALEAILGELDAARGPGDVDTRVICDARYILYGGRDCTSETGRAMPRCPRCHSRAALSWSKPGGIGETCLGCGNWRYM
jgi:hypothetical protein